MYPVSRQVVQAPRLSPRKGRALQAGPSLEIKLEGTGDVNGKTEMIGEEPLIKTKPDVDGKPNNA